MLIAGGVGITPLYSILLTAIQRKDERPFLLIYAVSSQADITYKGKLEAFKENLNLTIVYVLRKPADDWKGETGYVDRSLLFRYIPRHRGSRHYFVCAAPAMMAAVERALFDLEVPVTNVHMEHFNLA